MVEATPGAKKRRQAARSGPLAFENLLDAALDLMGETMPQADDLGKD